MTSVCRSSNLQALVDSCGLPNPAKPLLSAYNTIVNEDHRGTRLANEDHHPPTKPPRYETLDDESYRLLLQAFNEKFETVRYTSESDPIRVTRDVDKLEKVSIRGVVYAHERSLPRDSNVLFRRLGGLTSRVGRIQSIFCLRHPTPDGLMMQATYAIVREYLPFLDEAKQSQYTQFGFAGGFLCHRERWNRSHVVELTGIICHFAKFTLQGGFMHVLPLNKVRSLLPERTRTLTTLKMMDSYDLPSVIL
jgi:hypothetical protein